MPKKFSEMSEQEALRIVGLIAERTPRDRRGLGLDWQGEIEGVACKGYISPDGKVLRFMYGQEGPFQSLSKGAAFGFSLGDAAPAWARAKKED